MPLQFKGRAVTPHRVADAVVSRVRHHFVVPVIGAVPRLVLGNDAGIRGNIVGRRWLEQSRRAWRASNANPPPPTPEAAALANDGFAPLQLEYPAGAVAAVRERYLELINSSAASCSGGVGKFRDASQFIIDPVRTLPRLGELLTQRVRAIVESYYGGHFAVMHIRAWRTRHVSGLDAQHDAYSNQWHTDRFPTSMLRLFVYLSDGVTAETGAFRVHPIPSTKEILRSGGYLRRTLVLPHARRALEDESRIKYFTGDAGAACLANVQLCLHRAGIPRVGYDRDAVQFTLRPAARPLPPDWLERLPPDLAVLRAQE
jgi:hypothetical protein